jgi:hypothetical protein
MSAFVAILVCIAHTVPAPAARTLMDAASRAGFETVRLRKGQRAEQCGGLVARADLSAPGAYPNGVILYSAPQLSPAHADALMLSFATMLSQEAK